METLRIRLRKRFALGKRSDASLQEEPLRRELLSIDLLMVHARALAQRHQVGERAVFDRLLPRLSANEKILREYNDETVRAERMRRITPAAEWLLDNFHLIEEQIRTARRHLPKGFSRRLPHLVSGAQAGLPRVYDMALELISHIDGRIDATHLTSFVQAYQTVTHLKLGELWAVPIMLRLALIENLRRVAVGLAAERRDRDLADLWADRMMEAVENRPGNVIIVLGEMAQSQPVLSRAFVAEFWRRTQEKSPPLKLAVSWIEEHLAEEHLTVEQLVQSESQHQATTQISVGNSIGSLRFLDAMDWREFVESQSVVEQALRSDRGRVYAEMDFRTRDHYRHRIELISRYCDCTELEVATRAINLANNHKGRPSDREAHVGFYLVGQGIDALENAVCMKRPIWMALARLGRRHPLTFYVGGIVAVTLSVVIPLLIWAAGLGASIEALIALAILAGLAGSQLGVTLVNWVVTVFVKPTPLPRLDFSEGIPAPHATLVVVPTMLSGARGIEKLLESLEVRYLANRDDHICFALLTDFRDAQSEHMPGDEELIRLVSEGIQALNEKYKNDRPNIFYLFHRSRQWNEQERVWMGYERKRGKLTELNRCLRGGSPEGFSRIVGDLSQLPRIQYVITLDTDTELPRDAARQLAGTMAHPLNRPVYDPRRGLVVDGYSILQPRVAVNLPSASRSRFVQLFSGEPGLDPYTRAVSDVYQDLFQEGSFIGKGIYDVDAFTLAVRGKFPENRILSHDLLEGSYGRSALVSDVQLFEDFPSRYSVDMQRRHRWIRGDWQIATWLLPRLPGPDVRRVNNPLTGLSRWKIFDNLRRSLVPLSLLLLLPLGWVLFPGYALTWSLIFITLISLPFLLTIISELGSKPREVPPMLHFKRTARLAGRQAGQALLTIAFLPYDACVCLDAIVRTIARLIITRRNLLQWQTASEVEESESGTLGRFFATMWCSPVLALAFLAVPIMYGGSLWAATMPFLLAWLVSPVAAWWISLPLEDRRAALSPEEVRELRKVARKTWRFFELFVGAEDHWLPPDNFQENPRPLLATRTSPTNIGMALLSTLGAYDFGYVSLDELTDRVRQTLSTLEQMERYQGHFYNWYDTRTLKPLGPLYLSTVDNGNLAGLLLTLHAGLVELITQEWSATRAVAGLQDTLRVLREQTREPATFETLDKVERQLAQANGTPRLMAEKLDGVLGDVSALAAAEGWEQAFVETCRKHRDELRMRYPWLALADRLQPHFNRDGLRGLAEMWQELTSPQSLLFLAKQTRQHVLKLEEFLTIARNQADSADLADALAEFKRLLEESARQAMGRLRDLEDLGRRCDALARMDFELLYDQSRELFSIGYNVNQHRLDTSCYDLLASEARLASYVAIALGQVPQQHWFAMGRLLTTSNSHPTLISWSGSMFEYLMPLLVMPSYENTLLDVSCKSAVARQIEYGRQQNVPWGMSESGYNLRDADANYQYRAFGVPGLGFKRGLAQDIVVAPYASAMALMVAPRESYGNLQELKRQGGEGALGFYEAIDYTVSRVPRGQSYAVVQSYMAHHQGMTLLSLVDTLLDRPMQRRFTSNPLFKAAELLLHERVPKEISVLYPHELEAACSRETASAQIGPMLRVFTNPDEGPPEVHLLSNGRYHLMMTNSGGGYSRWNDVALTRWREDPTRDCWGTFLYLRDIRTGKFWSAAHQPVLQSGPGYEAIFSQGRAEYRCRLDGIVAHTEISVSPEDDVEVRRITLTNHSNETRIIEITTYAEIVLNIPAADAAHPAFSNLSVQTKLVPAQYAVIGFRRPRTPTEQWPHLGHVLLVQGTEIGKTTFETDRSRFVGRNRTAIAPAALVASTPLSNFEGSPLDPIIAIRRTISLEPKESGTATLVSAVSATHDGLMALIRKYQDQAIANRSFELAWTHGLIMLRHLNATEPDAQLYGSLASALLYHQPTRRAPASTLLQNRRGQQNLWSYGISGDVPIVLVYSTLVDNLDFVRQMIQAHSYWRLKGLQVDLVILNEDDSIYRQSLHDQILTLIATGNAAQLIDKPGGIFTRRVDQLSHEDRVLLESSARIVLSDRKGTLAEQLKRRVRPEPMPPALVPRVRSLYERVADLPKRDLIFFNGLGGFTRDGREYVVTLRPGQSTHAPWVNVLGSPNFGSVISENGSAYTWRENCHQFRLTPWHNDAVTDTTGEAFYIRDEDSGRFWSPTPGPARGNSPYVARHGFGYTVFEHTEDGITSELWIYVSIGEPVKCALLKVRNGSSQGRRLSVTGYWEWALGEIRAKNAMHVVTEFDARAGAVLARNHYNTDFSGRCAFVTCSEGVASVTCDRTEFVGRNRSLVRPAALGRQRLRGKTGINLDPCAALQVSMDLAPGEEREIAFTLGAGRDDGETRNLIQRFRNLDACRETLQGVWGFWNHTLGAVHVESPDPALNFLANGWLLYQTLSARFWARTGFYQSSGAFGFRDQLQDAMAFVHARPDLLREQLLRVAAHQFRAGDVQHWWHPPMDRGVRTHFSDDYLWLPYATCRYVEAIGDTGVLDENVLFLEGRPLRPDEEAYYETPQRSSESAALYEHCVRAIQHGLKFGVHGLPLIGCGDWNDGMNFIGQHGKGESVWLAFFLYDVLKHFAPIARRRGDENFAQTCDEEAQRLRANIETHGWDGQWYLRAYFDDGTPLGSASNPECQIDAIPQSWSVISGAGEPARSQIALQSVMQRLVKRDARLIQLFDPPFDSSPLEPGYIKGYVPGVRENGGQYTHAAIWTIMALALAGESAKAWDLFTMVNPILHGHTPGDAATYKVEPYVVAGDVYSLRPHTGRGGWTWYTGSAGWMYRLVIETFLGITREVDRLRFSPRPPRDWKSFKVHYRYYDTTYHLIFLNSSGDWNGWPKVVVEGVEQPEAVITLYNDRRDRQVEVRC